jgi:hypothetical protein
MKGSKDPQHNLEHFRRTAENSLKIADTLRVENKVDINLLQAICYLHDINHAYYNPGLINYFFETNRSKEVLPNVLNELRIGEKEKNIIKNAIYSSSFSFPFKRLNKNKDLYTQILQDADTLDFFHPDRIKSFNRSKNKYFFYKIIGLFSNWAVKNGRKNLSNYLNFPEIAKEEYVQKN